LNKLKTVDGQDIENNIAMNSGENKSLLCLFEQTKVIAGFYLGYVVLDFLVQGIGNAVIR